MNPLSRRLPEAKKGNLFSKAENPKYPDLIPADELVIQGVMVALDSTVSLGV